MKKSDMLRAAKAILFDGTASDPRQEIYVCIALDRSAGHYESNELQKWIMQHLGKTDYGCKHSARTWVEDKLRRGLSCEEAQAYRHAWVDNMIAYWESQGD